MFGKAVRAASPAPGALEGACVRFVGLTSFRVWGYAGLPLKPKPRNPKPLNPQALEGLGV